MKLFGRGVLIAVLIEIITVIARFYFGFESTRDTALVGNFTGGIRIHHGYIGALLMITTSISLRRSDKPSNTSFSTGHWLFTLGTGLLLSDLLHHFVVLQLITGDPQFDLYYPAP